MCYTKKQLEPYAILCLVHFRLRYDALVLFQKRLFSLDPLRLLQYI